MERATKRYGTVLALDGAHLSVAAGEVHALVGENGAGKSTLIRLLAGVERADSLEVTVDGRPVTIVDPGSSHRAGLRFVHQELNVVPALSVAETIVLGQPYPRNRFGLVAWKQLRERATAQLARLGIDHVDPRTPMSRLSVGDAMLVTIARAFASGENEGGLDGDATGTYVFDEPTAALSRRETDLLHGVIDDLRRSGAGVVYVSHRMDEIFAICDRITVLRDGCTVASTATTDTSRRQLIQAMTGRDDGHRAVGGMEIGDRTDAQVVLTARGLRNGTLRGVDLSLQAGTVTVVSGLAGSGRTELLKALIGADPLDAGTVHVGGRPLADAPRRRHDPHAAWQAGVAFLPEERRSEAVWTGGTVAAHLLLPHLRRVTRGGFVRERHETATAHDWASRVGVRSQGVKQRVDELSGGNQQKVILARALAGHPKVLLLDEPTRGVDVGAKEEIYALIARAARDGAAVLAVTSDLEEVFTLADRVLVMAHGRLVLDAQVTEVDREAILTASFGRREEAA